MQPLDEVVPPLDEVVPPLDEVVQQADEIVQQLDEVVQQAADVVVQQVVPPLAEVVPPPVAEVVPPLAEVVPPLAEVVPPLAEVVPPPVAEVVPPRRRGRAAAGRRGRARRRSPRSCRRSTRSCHRWTRSCQQVDEVVKPVPESVLATADPTQPTLHTGPPAVEAPAVDAPVVEAVTPDSGTLPIPAPVADPVTPVLPAEAAQDAIAHPQPATDAFVTPLSETPEATALPDGLTWAVDALSSPEVQAVAIAGLVTAGAITIARGGLSPSSIMFTNVRLLPCYVNATINRSVVDRGRQASARCGRRRGRVRPGADRAGGRVDHRADPGRLRPDPPRPGRLRATATPVGS